MSDQKMIFKIDCPHCGTEQNINVPYYGRLSNVAIRDGIEVFRCDMENGGCNQQFAIQFSSEFTMSPGRSTLVAKADVLVLSKPADQTLDELFRGADAMSKERLDNLHKAIDSINGESNAHTA